MSLVAVERSADVLAALPRAAALLTDTERARAARLRRVPDRDDFVAAHALVRLCAARALGVPAAGLTLTQRCETCDGAHGRPEIAGVHVSLAHSRGVVAAAAASEPVGIDVEGPGDVAVIDLVLSEAERRIVAAAADPARAFLELWVRKEALVKLGVATLDTLRDTPADAALLLEDEHAAAVAGGGKPHRIGLAELVASSHGRTAGASHR